MGVWKKQVYNNRGFTASLPDENLPNDYIKYLYIMLRADQNGTTALTLANYLAGLPTINSKLGGHTIVDISYADLLALDLKMGMFKPQLMQVGGGDDYFAMIGPLHLPLYVVKKGRELSAAFEYAAITNADGNVLDLAYNYVDDYRPVTDWPYVDWHYEIITFTGTGAASARTNISRAGALLVGLLVMSTNLAKATDAVGAGTSPEVSELDLECDNRTVYSDTYKTRCDKSVAGLGDDTTLGAHVAHYQYIDFSEQPWPADKLWAVTRNTVTTEGTAGTDPFRLIGVYVAP